MCIHLRDLDMQVTGSLTQAEAQRAEHRRLYDAVRFATTATYRNATEAWDGHIREHQRQAKAIRAQRAERSK